jgi:DNA-binding transcriptional ArsR family regulator
MPKYNEDHQIRVLKAVSEQCTLSGNKPSLDFEIDGMTSSEVMQHLRVLEEKKFIEAFILDDNGCPMYYPIRTTNEGEKYLGGANKAFWETFAEVVSSVLTKYTGVDFKVFFKFFRAVYEKFKNEKE